MSEPIYSQAISRAWRLVWHHKILWIFGVFSVCLGQFGLGDFIGRIWMLIERKVYSGVAWQAQIYQLWPNMNLADKIGLIWVIGICLGLGLLLVVLAVLAQGSLIIAAKHFYEDKKQIRPSKIWHESVKHFWRLLGVNVLRKILLGILAFAIAWLILTTLTYRSAWSVGGVLFALVISFFLVLFVSALTIYAGCYIATEDLEFIRAFKKSWRLLSSHLLVTLELSLILVLLNLLAFGAILVGSFIIALPIFFTWAVSIWHGYAGLAAFSLVLGFILMAILIVVVGSIFNAFTISAWTDLFMKMKKEGILSRVMHHLNKLFSR